MRGAAVRPAAALALLLLGTGLTACATAPPAATLTDGRIGLIPFRSVTLSMPQFLSGAPGGAPVEISGELEVP